MLAFPNAKINIGLYITEKRSDGFHNLQSCFYPIPWTDGLEIVEAEKTVFTTSGLEIPGNPDENLCLKAYRLLQPEFDLPPVHIHLHKVLPTGAGLGGGSADAAFTLKTLCALFGLPVTEEQQQHYARKLGSDCAFFICNQPVFAFGKGDEFEAAEVSLKGYFLVVVYPGLHIGTAEAYRKIAPMLPSQTVQKVVLRPVEEWKNQVRNDFEQALFPAYPELKNLKRQLYDAGAVYASMSGSGSAVYGIFGSQTDLKSTFPPGYLVWQGFLE